MNHATFLIAGYGITWIAVIGYLLRLRCTERDVGAPSRTVQGTTDASD